MSRWKKYKLGGCLTKAKASAAPELRVAAGSLPARADLRAYCSPIEDQGEVGSCTANAVVGAMEYHQRRAGHAVTDLSRLFVYYNTRALTDDEDKDTGAFIHHTMASVLAHGACPEAMWSYRQDRWAQKPPANCYDSALNFDAVQFARTPLGPVCKAALSAGLPIVFAASLPAEWMYASGGPGGRVMRPTGQWPEPGGGHAMLLVGYDDASRVWIMRNSWGADWGDNGHLYVDYDVLENYSHPHDYWTIGAIDRHDSLEMSGMESVKARAEIIANAKSEVVAALAGRKAELRSDIENDLARKKADIRSRVRGPGAGGGYDT